MRLTARVKELVERLMRGAEWTDAGQGWQGEESELRLSGWSRKRRVVVLRRPLDKQLAVVDEADPQQLRLSFAEVSDEVTVYEYAVLVTSLDEEILTLSEHYRDRANCEAVFRSLKSELGLRPIFHRKTDRMSGHLFISVLAYHLVHIPS